jgi:hypothetical protein
MSAARGSWLKSVMIDCADWQSESLQREILDLQSEFEFDRIDYLDTIRKQEQQNKWLQAVLDRIHPVIRRDCNYVSLEKIRSLSEWDENNQVWTLPKLTIEKTHLPPAGKLVYWVCVRNVMIDPLKNWVLSVQPIYVPILLFVAVVQ